jgi:ketosteroid isomerase-like protein
MKTLLTGLLSFCLLCAQAQTKKDSIQTITETLVNASAKAFNTFAYDQQFALVSKDATLILTDLSKIEDRQGYYNIIKQIGDAQKNRGLERTIQFRYHKLAIKKHLAYAEGMYKITFTNTKEGTLKNQYHAFRHVYRLEEGGWKLLVDSHTTNQDVYTEEDFLKAKAVTDIL